METKTCPKCGKENPISSYYCISCGESLKYVNATSNKKTAKASDIKGLKDMFVGIAGGIVLILVGVWALVWVTPRYELINAPDSLIPIAGIFNIGLGFVWLWNGMTGAIKLTKRNYLADHPVSKEELKIELDKEKDLQLLIQNKHVIRFYQTTLTAWSNGNLAKFSKLYKKEADEMQLPDIIKKYPPYEGTSLRAFLLDCQPLEGEFLIGMVSNWFVLTNIRLFQRDGRKNELNDFKEITLADIDTYKIKQKWTSTLVFKMKSGREIVFEKTQGFPSQEFISEWISHDKGYHGVEQVESQKGEPDPMGKTATQKKTPMIKKGQSVQKVVGITVCPNCKIKVLPKSDGTCPNCQSKII